MASLTNNACQAAAALAYSSPALGRRADIFPEFEIRRQRLAYRDPPHAFLAFGRANASIGRELLLNEDASVLDGDIGPRHPEGFCPSRVGVEHEHHACDVRVRFSIE